MLLLEEEAGGQTCNQRILLKKGRRAKLQPARLKGFLSWTERMVLGSPRLSDGAQVLSRRETLSGVLRDARWRLAAWTGRAPHARSHRP